MDGILKIICAPIGNLGDLTFRIKEELSKSKIIITEDTVKTLYLLKFLNIKYKTIKIIFCPTARENQKIKVIEKYLFMGMDVYFMTAAGSPCISDPGAKLIRSIIDFGFQIRIFPGPTAVITALLGAGFLANRFIFLGFIAKKGLKRRRVLLSVRDFIGVIIIYESAFRVRKSLQEFYEFFGLRRVVVGRELTKTFETFHRGFLGEQLDPVFKERGECVILINQPLVRM